MISYYFTVVVKDFFGKRARFKSKKGMYVSLSKGPIFSGHILVRFWMEFFLTGVMWLADLILIRHMQQRGGTGIAIVRLSDLFPRPGDGAGHGVATDPPTVVDELLNDDRQIRRVLIW